MSEKPLSSNARTITEPESQVSAHPPLFDGDDIIDDQLAGIYKLPEGWHYGEGRGATDQALSSAKSVVSLLRYLNSSVACVEVFPDIDGGIMLSVYVCAREGDTGSEYDDIYCADIYCRSNGTLGIELDEPAKSTDLECLN